MQSLVQRPMPRGGYFSPVPLRLTVLLAATLSWLVPVMAEPKGSVPPTAAECDCADPYRTYTREPTEEVKALFRAAEEGDEARFTELIAGVPDIAEYAVKGRPLLDVLLSLSPGLLPAKEHWTAWWNWPESRKRNIEAAHKAMLPARTRMLALALRHGASARDVAYYARRPPLHSALVWGTPEMVGLLLAHGADANQIGENGQTALELLLDPEFSRHAGFRPAFVSAVDRSAMIGMLIKAGARRPFSSLDDKGTSGRPAADALLWPALAAMTRGETPMEQLSALGTRPAVEDGKDKTLAMAARTGNLGGLRWLKPRMPRMTTLARWHSGGWKTEPFDLWMKAASWAVYPHTRFGAPGASRDEILNALIVRDMPWLQVNELSSREWDTMEPDALSFPSAGTTLLHHLVHAGAGTWVERVVSLGAPVDGAPGNSQTPLAQAVRDDNLPMVRRLLALGANPLGGNLKKSPLFEIVAPEPNWREETAEEKARKGKIRREMLEQMVARLTPEQKTSLAQPENSPFKELLGGYRDPDGSLVRALLTAGLPLPPLDSSVINSALHSSDPELITLLLDHGLRVKEQEKTDYPVLIAARGRPDLMARLMDAGANPNAPDKNGWSAVAWVVRRGDVAGLDLLLSRGGRLESAVAGRRMDALHELAVRSGSEAMLARLKLQSADLSSLCFAEKWGLVSIVLDSSESYWSRLWRQGFGKASGAACPSASSSERLLDAVLSDAEGYEAGWSGERLSRRLAQMIKRAPIPPSRGRAMMASAVAAGRLDVVHALRRAGFALPPPERKTSIVAPLTTAQRRAMGKLAGNYYLRGMREVGSQIRLNPDGRFAFMLSYGSYDRNARGQWRLKGDDIEFHTPAVAEAPDWRPFRRIEGSGESAPVPAGRFRVRVQYQERPIDGVTVTALGCAAPQRDTGRTSDGLWDGLVDGPLCQIVLRHASLQGGKPYVYEVPPAERPANPRDFVFEVVPGKQDAEQSFNVRMKREDGALIWLNETQRFHYVRE
ncbi:ankyrin repeat domain-containing protein [Paludibacterium paludis]|nr:ankyrin repeat domain-containing protein [Paludibacterium paludis]